MTRASAVEGIRAYGLIPAAALLARGGLGAADGTHRAEWTEVPQPDGAPAWLRWQRLGDAVLLRRLPPSITPAKWRQFINEMVFLSPSPEQAERLRSYPVDRGIAQVILRFDTAALLAAKYPLLTCQWNNGFPDRCRPPRERSYADYRPVSEWTGGNVSEVVVCGSLQSSFVTEWPTPAPGSAP